ncbi:uncharacterized protein [Clytia hemisphaerica]|uniref:uncharacterized protein n=1 Tax=Clytia hemisphaerica TaxID=252671 RepID=UPI0034D3F201
MSDIVFIGSQPAIPNASKYGDGGKRFQEMSMKQYQYSMLMKIQTIKSNQERILQILSGNIDNEPLDDLDQLIAMETMDQFDALEEELRQSREKRVKMRKQIKKIGGKDCRQRVKLALHALMSKALQWKFSKEGLTGKRKFIGTQMCRCIQMALIDQSTKKDIQDDIGYICVVQTRGPNQKKIDRLKRGNHLQSKRKHLR